MPTGQGRLVACLGPQVSTDMKGTPAVGQRASLAIRELPD